MVRTALDEIGAGSIFAKAITAELFEEAAVAQPASESPGCSQKPLPGEKSAPDQPGAREKKRSQ